MSLDLSGFSDVVADAQHTFRAVLDAMAHPGRIVGAGADVTPPSSLDPATAAVLLTLIDGDVRVWLDPIFDGARDWLAFHCGAQFAAGPAEAAFLVVFALPNLSILAAGTDIAPELSATLIVQVPRLGAGTKLHLSGPGLRVPDTLLVDGLPADFARRWAANHALYPRGVDLLLCCGNQLAALPRSVSVT